MAQDNNATFRFSPALHVPLTFRFEGMSQFHVKACSVQTPFMSFGGLLTKDEATSLVALLLRFPTFPGEWSHARNSHSSRGHLSGACCSPMVGLSLRHR